MEQDVSPSATALSSLRDQAPAGLAPDGLQSADAVAIIYCIGITAATIAFQMGWIS